MAILDEIYDATASGNYKNVVLLVQKAIEEKIPVQDIINKSLSKAMIDVGDKFGSGELYMPDMLLAAKAMKEAMNILKPLIKDDENVTERGTIVIGTVKGDLHD
ncbi:MAG: B12-binding domain-containing protein, partial [Actinobacteria bacterium]|nr:B12-binding domain-containing protein [Actinomycetota bacterium]